MVPVRHSSVRDISSIVQPRDRNEQISLAPSVGELRQGAQEGVLAEAVAAAAGAPVTAVRHAA